jgi:hypothetical protein
VKIDLAMVADMSEVDRCYSREPEGLNEACIRRPATDPSFADILDRSCAVLGGHRNLSLVRRPLLATSTTPTLKTMEAALQCQSCRTPRYSPRVHLIKVTQRREIAPYKWVHPDDDERW